MVIVTSPVVLIVSRLNEIELPSGLPFAENVTGVEYFSKKSNFNV